LKSIKDIFRSVVAAIDRAFPAEPYQPHPDEIKEFIRTNRGGLMGDNREAQMQLVNKLTEFDRTRRESFGPK
jgi:hypothetical protein